MHNAEHIDALYKYYERREDSELRISFSLIICNSGPIISFDSFASAFRLRSLDWYFPQWRYYISSLFVASLRYLSLHSMAVLLASSRYYLTSRAMERRKRKTLACFNVRDHCSMPRGLFRRFARSAFAQRIFFIAEHRCRRIEGGEFYDWFASCNYDKSFVRHGQICMRRISVNAMRARFIVIIVAAPAVFLVVLIINMACCVYTLAAIAFDFRMPGFLHASLPCTCPWVCFINFFPVMCHINATCLYVVTDYGKHCWCFCMLINHKSFFLFFSSIRFNERKKSVVRC
jgi:hypothetical protein